MQNASNKILIPNISNKEEEIVNFCISKLKQSNSKSKIIEELTKSYKGYTKKKLSQYIEIAYAKLEKYYRSQGVGDIVIEHIEKYERIYTESLEAALNNINDPDPDARKYAREQFKLALNATSRQEAILGAIGKNSKNQEFLKNKEEQKDDFNFSDIEKDKLLKIKALLDKHTINTPKGIRKLIIKEKDEKVESEQNSAKGIFTEIKSIIDKKKSKDAELIAEKEAKIQSHKKRIQSEEKPKEVKKIPIKRSSKDTVIQNLLKL